MPPTRSEPRQGSSRPVAQSRHGSVLDVRPVEGAITLSSDDESPPRKKAAVEKKTVRQRSKQKARVPLPPTTEVIEISSDDEVPVPKRPSGSMTALERRIKELEEVGFTTFVLGSGLDLFVFLPYSGEQKMEGGCDGCTGRTGCKRQMAWSPRLFLILVLSQFQTKPQPQLEVPHKQPTPPADTRFDKVRHSLLGAPEPR